MTTHITIIKLDGTKGRERVLAHAHTDRIYAEAEIHGLLEQRTPRTGSRQAARPASNLHNYEAIVLTRRQASDLYKQLRAALYKG